MFNLFDEDGNGNISIEELLNMMAFFIEIGRVVDSNASDFYSQTFQEWTPGMLTWPRPWPRCSPRGMPTRTRSSTRRSSSM